MEAATGAECKGELGQPALPAPIDTVADRT